MIHPLQKWYLLVYHKSVDKSHHYIHLVYYYFHYLKYGCINSFDPHLKEIKVNRWGFGDLGTSEPPFEKQRGAWRICRACGKHCRPDLCDPYLPGLEGRAWRKSWCWGKILEDESWDSHHNFHYPTIVFFLCFLVISIHKFVLAFFSCDFSPISYHKLHHCLVEIVLFNNYLPRIETLLEVELT